MAYDENGRALRETVVHDPVVSNAIFRETLKKERNFHIRQEFTLTPKAMNTIPPKPNLVVAGEMPEDMAKKQGLALQAMDRNTIQELNTILRNQHSCPSERYAAPMTSQQEIGWFAGAYARNFRGRKQFGYKNNEITKYAEAYKITVGRNPFHKRPPITNATT